MIFNQKDYYNGQLIEFYNKWIRAQRDLNFTNRWVQ
jgi:hypothetical protein